MVLPCVRKIPRRLRMEKLRWYGDSVSIYIIIIFMYSKRIRYRSKRRWDEKIGNMMIEISMKVATAFF